MSRSFGGRSLTTRSPIEISPAVISSRPATMRRVVVLPQPDGPTKTMNSLSRIVRFTSLTACTSSYFLLRSLRTTCAIGFSPSNRFSGVGCPGRLASPLHGAGEAGDVVLHEERIDDGDRDRAQQRPRHELPPEIDVAADQLRDDPPRNRHLLRRRQEDQRVDELVPRKGEREDAGREDAGHRDREDDANHRPEAGGPVDAGALLELLGNGLEVAH